MKPGDLIKDQSNGLDLIVLGTSRAQGMPHALGVSVAALELFYINGKTNTTKENAYLIIKDEILDVLGIPPLHRYVWCGYSIVPNLSGYSFQFIAVSRTDPSRLSGFARNKLGIPGILGKRAKHGTYLKLGKFVKALTGKNDHKLISRLQTWLARNGNLWKHIQVSTTPSEIYITDHANSGSIDSSCMRNKPPEFFQFYDNLEVCKIAYLMDKDNNELIGRALLWEAKVRPGGKTFKFMDRIYSANVNVENTFKVWAHNNGYAYKAEQSYTSKTKFVLPGQSEETEIEVFIHAEPEISRCEALPYMDTLTYFYESSDVLMNVEYEYEVTTSLEGTDGEDTERWFTHPLNQCENCGAHATDAETYYVPDRGNYCQECFDQLFARCELCDEYFSIDDTIIVDDPERIVCQSCYDWNGGYRCDMCGIQILPTDPEMNPIVDETGTVYCPDCAPTEEELNEAA